MDIKSEDEKVIEIEIQGETQPGETEIEINVDVNGQRETGIKKQRLRGIERHTDRGRWTKKILVDEDIKRQREIVQERN